MFDGLTCKDYSPQVMYIASTLFDFMLKAEEILSFKTVFIVHSFEKNICIIYICIYIYRSEQYISLMSLLFLLVLVRTPLILRSDSGCF